jgi:hypothetical protein
MKTHRILAFSILSIFLLSACGSSKATDTATPALSAADIYTAVAGTLTAQAPPTEAPTDIPTEVPTDVTTDTPAVVPTDYPAYSYQTMTPATSITTGGCDNSVYVSDVTISDGTTLAPGQSFTKTWKLQNTGTCTWSTSYNITFVTGSQMSGVNTSLPSSVGPSTQVNVSVTMVAPTTEGSYTGYWRLTNAAGSAFGSTVWVKITVSSSASTTTATVTPTPTGDTLTPTLTRTPGPTKTATTKPPTKTATTEPPTKTATNTPTPTATSS